MRLPTPTSPRSTLTWLGALAVAVLLGGCALPRRIDSTVQSFVGVPAAVAPATYRFERLPSQAAAPTQAALEAQAAVALSRVGLHAGTALPHYTVQVSASATVVRHPPAGGYGHLGLGLGHRRGDGAFGFMVEPPWYRYAVHLLLRDAASGQPVYETSAQLEGPWSDTDRLLPVVLDAALQGYPNPPTGPRTVVTELPGSPRP